MKQISGHESGFDMPYSENVCRLVGGSKARWIAGSNSGIGKRPSVVPSDTGDGSEIVVVENILSSEFGIPVDIVVVVVVILSGISVLVVFTICTASLFSIRMSGVYCVYKGLQTKGKASSYKFYQLDNCL